MSLSDFFLPIDINQITPYNGFLTSQLGFKAEFYGDKFPQLTYKSFDMAIIGVQEERGTADNKGCALAPNYFRQKFYTLNEGTYAAKIVDLGNIKAGQQHFDTYLALKITVEELIKLGILPIIIGGSQDLTYPQYTAYENLKTKVDLVVIDPKFDIEEDFEETAATTSSSYLSKILLHRPNCLFNFSNIGYQTYFVSQESLKMMDNLFFDTHRLGEFSKEIQLTEPIIRNANMISFDMAAIRSSDACANANASPNGFYGEDACRLARYAGMNDKLTSIGFYEFNPKFDNNGLTALLLAQMVWYFVDGFYNRKQETPMQPKSNFTIFRANLANESKEITYIKSNKTDRWWMQVPYPNNRGSDNERFHWVPCRYEDYNTAAVNGQMPDLWWRTYQKLL